MIRYVIRNKKTGEFLQRSSTGYQTWVADADKASLITTGSAASSIINNNYRPLGKNSPKYSTTRLVNPSFDVEAIRVNVILIPVNQQPYLTNQSLLKK